MLIERPGKPSWVEKAKIFPSDYTCFISFHGLWGCVRWSRAWISSRNVQTMIWLERPVTQLDGKGPRSRPCIREKWRKNLSQIFFIILFMSRQQCIVSSFAWEEESRNWWTFSFFKDSVDISQIRINDSARDQISLTWTQLSLHFLLSHIHDMVNHGKTVTKYRNLYNVNAMSEAWKQLEEIQEKKKNLFFKL